MEDFKNYDLMEQHKKSTELKNELEKSLIREKNTKSAKYALDVSRAAFKKVKVEQHVTIVADQKKAPISRFKKWSNSFKKFIEETIPSTLKNWKDNYPILYPFLINPFIQIIRGTFIFFLTFFLLFIFTIPVTCHIHWIFVPGSFVYADPAILWLMSTNIFPFWWFFGPQYY